MTTRGKRWLIASAGLLLSAVVAMVIAGSILAKRFEPMVREAAIRYLRDRFHSDVELRSLRIYLPKMSRLEALWKRGRGAKVQVEGEGLSMRFSGSRTLPPLFSVRKLRFVVDLGTLMQPRKVVDAVWLEGMQINIPPKGQFPSIGGGASEQNDAARQGVLIKQVQIKDAVLILLPRDPDKQPLRFPIHSLALTSVGTDGPMKYAAALLIPKPPGEVRSTGSFGPWNGTEPGDTPVTGNYSFEKADLGVFRGIAGILHSSGSFDGTLDSIHARGEASVPEFRLKMTGTPVPLTTTFEVLVDGTNGDTVLQPVKAILGNTAFTTTGAVIKHEKERHRSINLQVFMPNGDMRDLLRLTVKGPPFMEGRIKMNSRIEIPPLSGKVVEKLRLDGRFEVSDAKFLRSTIQSQIDQLSRRGRGQPENREIDEVASDMTGSFRLEDQVMTFRALSFFVPGAHVALAGNYDLDHDTVEFHGTLKLKASVSQTMTGWKRWALKPVDPFFSKHGVGTYLPIKVVGSSRKPQFGPDFGRGL